MKKLTLFLSAIALSLGSVNLSFATFIDVPSTHPNYEAINFVQRMEIVQGYPDGTYQPDKEIDRYEFTKIIVGALYTKAQIDACKTSPFPDVPMDWFTPYVCMAQKEGIVSGYPDGTFQGINHINLAEAAKIMVNAYKHTVQTDPIWFKPYVMKLEELKALPISLKSFDHQLTRAEMAEIIRRLDVKDTTKTSTTYANLEAGVMVKAEEPKKDEVYVEKTSYDKSLALQELGVCENVEDIPFKYNADLKAHYGAFSWTGKIKSFKEDDGTHLRLEVKDDGELAFDYYKELALAWNNEGFIRYENEMLYFQVGSLDGVNLVIATNDIDDEARALILNNYDKDKEVTLKFAQNYYIGGGGAGNFGMTVSCSVKAA